MNFDLDDIQLEFASLAASYFGEHSGTENARARLDDPAETTDLRSLAELGFPAILVPAELGGLGQTTLEMAVVAEQAGRVLSSPSMSTFARVSTLLADSPDHLSGLVDGSVSYAVLDGSPRRSNPSVDALGAERFLALEGDALIVGHGSHLDCDPIDASRGLSRVELLEPQVLAPDAKHRWDRARDIACVVMAAEDLGTAQRALDLALEHARGRETFGRAIGSYQSLKHRLVDVWADIDQLRSLTWWAAWIAEAHQDQLPLAASAVKAYAARVVEQAADLLVHVHGGLGFTWEHDAHLFWRRAKVDRHLLGTRSWHLDRVARLSLQQRSAGEVTTSNEEQAV